MEKDQDLRPCLSPPQPRQGRSLWLPTLPYQQTNRYAVVGVIPTFVSFRFCIGYANRYAVDGTKPVLVSFRLCIGYINRYAVTSVMPVFVSFRLRISHTNRYAVDGAKPVLVSFCLCIGYINCYAVVGTTPLICAWTVMGCLLFWISYIIKGVYLFGGKWYLR